jgi:hypothetical protein
MYVCYGYTLRGNVYVCYGYPLSGNVYVCYGYLLFFCNINGSQLQSLLDDL